jgi:hypothetical protein
MVAINSKEITNLREQASRQLQALRVQSKPIIEEIARLERLLDSLDEFVHEEKPSGSPKIGFLNGVRSPANFRSPRGTPSTPHKDFTLPILESLEELGGKASRDAVLRKLEGKLNQSFKPGDFETIKNSAEPRWRNRASFQRKNMTIEGLLRSNSPYGIWEMTPEGRQHLEEYRKLLATVFGDEKK